MIFAVAVDLQIAPRKSFFHEAKCKKQILAALIVGHTGGVYTAQRQFFKTEPQDFMPGLTHAALSLPILIDPTRPATQSTREGLGDLRVSAAYDLPVRGFFASVRTGAKLPTASTDKSLGTGKADYSIGADIAKPLGAVMPFAGVTYSMAGDLAGFELRNSFSGQAGAALRLGKTTNAQLSYAFAQSPLEAGDDDQRIVGGLNTGVGKDLSLGVYGSGGLSDGAPDIGGGVTLGLKFGQ